MPAWGDLAVLSALGSSWERAVLVQKGWHACSLGEAVGSGVSVQDAVENPDCLEEQRAVLR